MTFQGPREQSKRGFGAASCAALFLYVARPAQRAGRSTCSVRPSIPSFTSAGPACCALAAVTPPPTHRADGEVGYGRMRDTADPKEYRALKQQFLSK